MAEIVATVLVVALWAGLIAAIIVQS